MKVDRVTFYQSVRTPKKSGNEINAAGADYPDTRGCEVVFHKGCVVVSHPQWELDCIVGLANIRSMNIEKGAFLKSESPVSAAVSNETPKVDTEKEPRSTAPKK